jgi:hypothetical protein
MAWGFFMPIDTCILLIYDWLNNSQKCAAAMDIEKLIKTIMLLVALFGVPFAVYNYMNELHATKAESLRDREQTMQQIEDLRKKTVKIDLQANAKILDTDLDRKAEIRHHYKQLKNDRELEPSEELRMEYLEDQLERGYQQQDMIQSQLMKMESEE